MTRDNEHNLAPNANARRIVGRAVEADPAKLKTLGDDLAIEAAWQAWSGCIQNVDERGLTLLRAAFEARWDASHQRHK